LLRLIPKSAPIFAENDFSREINLSMSKSLFSSSARRPRWLKAVLLTLALPLCAFGLFCLVTAYKIYASNEAEKHLSVAPAPHSGQRLLVFAPHPDDETLGAAGLMRQARLRGDDVRVVIITNGDGFRISAAQEFHELTVPPKDFVRYGYLRQGEARTALGVLGIPADHIYFLGYPDRGLMPMWIDHWAASTPVASAYTLESHSPYTDAVTPNAAYCGSALLADIKRQMLADQPTDIYVTHPNDDHPDHAAASVFVRTALEQLKASGVAWAQTAHLHYYLVHRGDWPTPQGLHEDAALLPPGPMASLDTHWTALPLSKRDTQKKYTAIKRYRSQVEMSSRFLYSFARQNELFGTLGPDNQAPGLAVVPNGRFHMDGDPKDWAGQTPVALDPKGDSVMRAFQSSGDIVRLFACRDSRFVYVRMDLDKALSPEVAYTFTLRPITASSFQPAASLVTIQPGPAGRALPLPGIPGGSYAWRGTLLEAALPLSALSLSRSPSGETLYVMGQTRFADVEIDRTGFHAVNVGGNAPQKTARR
jgi:LmbE family N-acetylglucosaminyl deacetylase